MLHKFTYIDHRSGQVIGKFLGSSILDTDKALNATLPKGREVHQMMHVGCRIDFSHCHSESCRKESFTATSCDCGFTAAHISPDKIKGRLKTKDWEPLYKPKLKTPEGSKLQDIAAVLADCKRRSQEVVLNPEDLV